MNAMIETHNAEIRTVMEAALNGQLPEADAVRTIILLQRELIIALVCNSSLNGTMGDTTDGIASLIRKAA